MWMWKERLQNLMIPIIIVVIILGYVLYSSLTNVDNYKAKYEGADLTSDVEGTSRKGTYAQYLEDHGGVSGHMGSGSVVLTADDLDESSVGCRVVSGKEFADAGKDAPFDKVIISSGKNGGSAVFKVNVEKEGFYYMNLTYFPTKEVDNGVDSEPETSRGIDIERCLQIYGTFKDEETGEVREDWHTPFSGADDLIFTRIWADSREIKTDNQGNEIRPSQTEISRWENSFFKDDSGYIVEPYLFYLKAGENDIRLDVINEPFVIGEIEITADYDLPAYADYHNKYASERNAAPADFVGKVQGETAVARSSASLYELFDRSSSVTEPASVAKVKLNMIGGDNWRIAGQWLEWDMEIPEDGFYNISIKARQNYERGMASGRSLQIDGRVPFEEASVVSFNYNTNWKLYTLSDADNNPYEFYMTKGTHKIRLEVTMGEMGELLQEMEDSVYRMNQMYRRILVLTGVDPDPYRDYEIDEVYPDVMDAMALESKRLYKMVDDVAAVTGQRGSNISTIQSLAIQLEKFCKKPEKIPKQLTSFKENVSGMGTTILNLSETKVDIDYIVVSSPNAKLPKVSENVFVRALHELKSFVASFFNDYNNLGDVYEGEEAVTVWMFAGRDQSVILKTIIDETFTPKYGIKVNVKLVDAGTLLPAVVAGTGPDVALSVQQSEPVNFALRNAALDLRQFDDLDEVLSEYNESAYMPFIYQDATGKVGTYALPETQNYPVMFYRTDVLEELGVEPPETWDDLISILPTIQTNNLNVGLPSTERKINNSNVPDMSLFYSMLFQNGGEMYNPTGSATLMDSEEGVAGFETLTKFFTQYKLPIAYDSKSRFRTGELPIIVGDYSLFNELSVSAPEIKGLWDFKIIPGTIQRDEDGNPLLDSKGNVVVDHTTTSWGVCSMMLRGCKDTEKAWTFMKWWASSDTQVRYGRELESVMGEAARYATANTETVKQLSWSASELEVLETQRKMLKGVPEVAGGYYTNRHIVNAVRKVLNENADPRETLLDYTTTINEELTKKRKEFNLPTAEDYEKGLATTQ